MTDFLSKINQLDDELELEPVHQQVREVNEIVSCIKQKKVLPRAPEKLGFLPDFAEKICTNLPNRKVKQFQTVNQLINNLREFLAREFGIWSVPNLTTAELIKNKLNVKTGLEIMAGNAYWSKALAEVGVEMTATDNFEWSKTSKTGTNSFIRVQNLNAEKALSIINNVDLIICSWAPNFGQYDEKLVLNWRNNNFTNYLLFVGEKNGATNSPIFWRNEHFVHSKEMMQINRSFASFDFIEEHIFEIAHEN